MFDQGRNQDIINDMILLILTSALILAAGIGGFYAGVKNANSAKVKAVKDVAKVLRRKAK